MPTKTHRLLTIVLFSVVVQHAGRKAVVSEVEKD